MKKIRSFKKALQIFSSLFLALVFSACHGSKEEKGQEPVQVISDGRVRISSDAMTNLGFAKAELTDFPDTLSVMGKISPTEDKTYVVSARGAGRIESVMVASGETVSAGQPLAMIFSPDYIASREEFLQSVRKQSSGDSSVNDFSGLAVLARRKLESMGLSKQDIDNLANTANQKDQAGSTVAGNLIVRAPHSGALITKNAALGNTVNQGDPLFTIADLHEVWFLGDVYPEDLSKVKKGQEVIVANGPDGKPLKGKVSFISPVVDPTTRTIKVRVLVPNPSLALRADMYMQGNLILSAKRALTIPTKSILREANENYVFKTSSPKNVEGHANGIDAQKVKVSIGAERDGQTAVLSGLNPGDELVSSGALLLNAALTNSEK